MTVQRHSWIKTTRYYLRPARRVARAIKRLPVRLLRWIFRRYFPNCYFYLTHKIKHKPQKLNEWHPEDKAFLRPNFIKTNDKIVLASPSFLGKHSMCDGPSLLTRINHTLLQTTNTKTIKEHDEITA